MNYEVQLTCLNYLSKLYVNTGEWLHYIPVCLY